MVNPAPVFPNNLVDAVIACMTRYLGSTHTIVPRRLGVSESVDTIGVHAGTWRPVEGSILMGQTGDSRVGAEPTLNYYSVRVQNLRIDADETTGPDAFYVTTKKIRAILYRDPELHVALRSLTEELLGTIERMKKMEIVKQDYLDSLTNMGMYYLCTTEIVFETESTPLS